MVNQLTLNLVNSLLGQGKPKARNNYAYVCPFHVSNPPGKINFEVNLTEDKNGNNPWHCWSCDARGKKLSTLFDKLGAAPNQKDELKSLVKSSKFNTYDTVVVPQNLQLPKEYKSLLSVTKYDIIGKHALNYIKSRNISKEDIIKYNIGYCSSGKYSNRIIIPTYDGNGKLNYFISRSFNKDEFYKYINPVVSRDIIPNEHLINWDVPVILCEGLFDAIAIKRNAIPLLGKNIQKSLMKKLIKSKVDKIYVALDNDALVQSLRFCENLMNEGKEVYLINLNQKDPSDMGFKNFTNLIQTTSPLTYYSLMEKKLTI